MEENGESGSSLCSWRLWVLLSMEFVAFDAAWGRGHSQRCAKGSFSGVCWRELQALCDQNLFAEAPSFHGIAGSSTGWIWFHHPQKTLHSLWREYLSWCCSLCHFSSPSKHVFVSLINQFVYIYKSFWEFNSFMWISCMSG